MYEELELEDFKAIREFFQTESLEKLAAVEEAVLTLEEYPDDTEQIRDIFRVIHSIKGNASMIGLENVCGFAHAFEDLLDKLREHALEVSPKLVSLLLAAVDAMKNMIPDAVRGETEIIPGFREIMRQLEEASSGAVSQAESEPEKEKESSDQKDGGGQARRPSSKTLRVGIDRLDRILDLVGEIAISRGRVSELLENENTSISEISEAHFQADLQYVELQELVMKIRMVPIAPLFRSYVRTVRDIAADSRKNARLVIEDHEVEVDTAVVDHLRDPITHLIRNSLNHGIESPEDRIARGKPKAGKITLRAYYESGGIVIQIEDDGRGLDRENIRGKAEAAGMLKAGDRPSDQDLYQFIFEPGFSTTDNPTEISGRGVGMDVVKRNVEMLRGSVSVKSEDGKGATITMRLPLTLAIIEGFRVGVREESYVVPMDSIVECVELAGEDRDDDYGFGMVSLRGKPLPFVHLGSFFGLDGEPAPRESLVVVRHDGKEIGLAVDHIYGEGQTVIKPLSRLLNGISGFTGTAIMGNGKVAFVLDIPGLLKATMEKYAEATG